VEAATHAPTLQGNRIRIALSPAHLGDLLIELTFQGPLLHGSVRTESAAAREMIESQLGQLLASLEGQGIQVGEFQVTVDGSFKSASEESIAGGRREAGDPARETVGRPRSVRRQLLDVTV
jgi:flagellar hook-length control protein FliK